LCQPQAKQSRGCHFYDLVLAPTGLKLTQFIVLYVIGQAGEIAHCELADHFAASEETFSRRLASARKSGWVSVKNGERNRPVYRLTDRGRALLKTATPLKSQSPPGTGHTNGA